MNRRVVLAVVALVALAGCLAPFGATPRQVTPAAPADDAPALSVSATGAVTAAPDRAVVRAAVVRTAGDAETARAGLAGDVAAVRDALRAADVPDDAVETTSFGVTPVYDGDDGRDGVPSAYRATHALAVETAVGDAGRTVDVVVGAGADEVYGVSFVLSAERRADLRSEAVAAAVTAARADADAAAGAAGLSVDRVVSVTVQDDGGLSPFFARAEAADAGTSFDPAPVTVRASVTVGYAAS